MVVSEVSDVCVCVRVQEVRGRTYSGWVTLSGWGVYSVRKTSECEVNGVRQGP
jgi:hypothetical protein